MGWWQAPGHRPQASTHHGPSSLLLLDADVLMMVWLHWTRFGLTRCALTSLCILVYFWHSCVPSHHLSLSSGSVAYVWPIRFRSFLIRALAMLLIHQLRCHQRCCTMIWFRRCTRGHPQVIGVVAIQWKCMHECDLLTCYRFGMELRIAEHVLNDGACRSPFGALESPFQVRSREHLQCLVLLVKVVPRVLERAGDPEDQHGGDGGLAYCWHAVWCQRCLSSCDSAASCLEKRHFTLGGVVGHSCGGSKSSKQQPLELIAPTNPSVRPPVSIVSVAESRCSSYCAVDIWPPASSVLGGKAQRSSCCAAGCRSSSNSFSGSG